jgi:hypothetical protein
MIEFDHVERSNGDARVEGRGWLVGPYLALKASDRPLYFHGYMLYGQTDNEISPFGTYTDDFETERFLVHAELTGEVERGAVTWFPNLSASYTSDDQESYTDSLGNRIEGQKIEIGQVALGLDFSRPLGGPVTAWTLDGGLTGSYTFRHGSDGNSYETVEGARARVDLGVSHTGDGSDFRVSGFYDGIGAPGYEHFGLGVSYELSF